MITNEIILDLNEKRLLEGVFKETVQSKLPYNSVIDLSRSEVGYEGEKNYFDYLNLILNLSHCKIEWLNKESEKGLPYDFKIVIGDKEFLVDVKTTKGLLSNPIYMSKRELEFSKNTENYYIARLYEGETDKGKLRAGSFNVEFGNVDKFFSIIKLS